METLHQILSPDFSGETDPHQCAHRICLPARRRLPGDASAGLHGGGTAGNLIHGDCDSTLAFNVSDSR